MSEQNPKYFPTPEGQPDYDPEPVYIEQEAEAEIEEPETVAVDDLDAFDDDFNIVLDDGMGNNQGDADAEKLWYVVHCYSGYENKVRHSVLQRIESMGMNDRIFDVLIPTEEEVEVKDGKRRTVERRVLPGYVLVQMKMDEDSWYVVRNTPGVTGFVGMGNDPVPLRPDEVKRILNRMEAPEPSIKVNFKLGQKVRIVGGPFNEMIGAVAEIDTKREKVTVMVDFFGRETPVELDFLEVEPAG